MGGGDGSPRHVNMLTLHSAKGCEYDVVYMVGMDQGAMPWVNESEAELRESRRLFYVGPDAGPRRGPHGLLGLDG